MNILAIDPGKTQSPMLIKVYGDPATQGNKKFMGIKAGRGVMIESSKGLKPWREAVIWAAREALAHSAKLLGSVAVEITFTLKKPAYAPKKRTSYPDRKPDLDKLTRAVFDALTTSGVIEDDARIVECVARKVFPNEHIHSLDVPGAVIRLLPLATYVAETRCPF